MKDEFIQENNEKIFTPRIKYMIFHVFSFIFDSSFMDIF